MDSNVVIIAEVQITLTTASRKIHVHAVSETNNQDILKEIEVRDSTMHHVEVQHAQLYLVVLHQDLEMKQALVLSEVAVASAGHQYAKHQAGRSVLQEAMDARLEHPIELLEAVQE